MRFWQTCGQSRLGFIYSIFFAALKVSIVIESAKLKYNALHSAFANDFIDILFLFEKVWQISNISFQRKQKPVDESWLEARRLSCIVYMQSSRTRILPYPTFIESRAKVLSTTDIFLLHSIDFVPIDDTRIWCSGWCDFNTKTCIDRTTRSSLAKKVSSTHFWGYLTNSF